MTKFDLTYELDFMYMQLYKSPQQIDPCMQWSLGVTQCYGNKSLPVALKFLAKLSTRRYRVPANRPAAAAADRSFPPAASSVYPIGILLVKCSIAPRRTT